MNCADFARILEDAREPGSAAAARRAELESHAVACASCAGLLSAEDRLHASLRSLRISSRVVPFGFEARVKRAVREDEAARARRHVRPLRAHWPVVASALASAIAIGAIVMMTLRDGGSPRATAIGADGSSLPTAISGRGATPVLFSDGRIEVITRQPVEAATLPVRGAPSVTALPRPSGPAPGPAEPSSGIVLVEWEL